MNIAGVCLQPINNLKKVASWLGFISGRVSSRKRLAKVSTSFRIEVDSGKEVRKEVMNKMGDGG